MHREPEVHVVVVHSQEDGKVAAKVIKQPKNQTTGTPPPPRRLWSRDGSYGTHIGVGTRGGAGGGPNIGHYVYQVC